MSQTTTPNHLKGALLAFAAAICCATLNMAVRIAGADAALWQIMVGRSLVGVVLIYATAKIYSLNVWGNNPKQLIIIGVSTVAGVCCLTLGLMVAPMFQVLSLYYLNPALAAALAPLLCRERTTAMEWFFIFMGFFGTCVVLYSGYESGGSLLGPLLGIGAALGGGFSFCLIRRMKDSHSMAAPIFYLNLSGVAICLPIALMTPAGWPVDWFGVWAIAAVGVVALLVHTFLFKSLKEIPASNAGVICMLEVPITGYLGWAFYDEALTLQQLLGAVMLLASGVGLSMRPGGKGGIRSFFAGRWTYVVRRRLNGNRRR